MNITKQYEAFRFTDEQMEIAKSTDLPELLEHLGYHIKRVGSRYHTTREMDSLMIKDRRTWKRYSNGKAGDAITFLQEFCGKGFREAVDYLLEFNGGRARDSPSLPEPRAPPQPEERPEFVLPPANGDNRRVFAYLRKRGIAPQVIRAFLDSGLLYEDEKHHNCVFVGRDGSGQPKFACKRGTYDKDGVSYKRDVLGSDKSVAFSLPCDPAVPWVAVFEAPIDLMSFCTLHREVRSNAVALCGLSSGALDTYLRDNPNLQHVVLCLDADEPGQEAVKRLSAEYMSQGLKVSVRVPAKGKDWNEYLQQRGLPREQERCYHVDFAGADIFPQGFAAVADQLRNFRGVNMLADIGNGTMNVMYINDRRPQEKKCFTEKYGTHQCMLAVRENLLKLYGSTADETVIDRVLRYGTAEISERYLTAIQTTAREYVAGIFRRLRD